MITEYTKRLFRLAIDIAKAAKENRKEYFIGGGLAIDFSIGRITRNHHDIDFHSMLIDAMWWKKWFEDNGYKVKGGVNPKFTEIFGIENNDGETIVDMWPFKLEGEKLMIRHQGKYIDSERHWEETRGVNYEGVNIRIENPDRVLDQKLRHIKKGEKIRVQDLHDFKLLGRKPL